jgi:hypothetical protein
MTYNVRDDVGFPPPAPTPKVVDWQTLCDMVDGSKDYPVAYSFGGNAPTMISIGKGLPFAISTPFGYARMFVELSPYYWNPGT